MYASLGPADDTEETVSRTFAARLKITINICNIAAKEPGEKPSIQPTNCTVPYRSALKEGEPVEEVEL